MTTTAGGPVGIVRGWRDVAGLVVVAVITTAGVLWLPSTLRPVYLAGLVLLVAGSLLLDVELPWGGQVLLGHAVVIAFAVLLPVTDFLVVVGLALALVSLAQVRRYGLVRGVLGVLVLVAGAGAALAGRLAGNAIVSAAPFHAHSTASHSHKTAEVLPVFLAGVAYFAVVLALQALIPAVGGRPRGWRTVISVYACLLCAAALLAVAVEDERTGSAAVLFGAVAIVPLLVLRYSFHRYFEARRTYLQASQALSMIPEVAGLTSLGHGERTAVYASALAEWMEFSPEQVDQAATVARLHHIGQIAHPDLPRRPYGPYPEERRLISQSSLEILSETGFLKDVASLVAAVQSAEPWQVAPLEAVVRVCSTLDDLVGDEARGLSDAIVGLLARHDSGLERTVALRLAQLCDARPEIAVQAVAAGSMSAMAGADLA